MKKLLLILFSAVALSSCELIPFDNTRYYDAAMRILKELQPA